MCCEREPKPCLMQAAHPHAACAYKQCKPRASAILLQSPVLPAQDVTSGSVSYTVFVCSIDKCDGSPWWAQVSKSLLQCKQEGQAEMVDLHTLNAKEPQTAVLCMLRNIQLLSPPSAHIPCIVAPSTCWFGKMMAACCLYVCSSACCIDV